MFFGFRTGQELDEKKMNRDLEIAKNILATLIKTGSESWFGGNAIEASYIKDYGVVFTIPAHLVYFNTGGNSFIAIPDIPPMPEFAPIPDIDFNEDFYENDVDVEIDKEKLKAEMKRDQEKEKEEMKRAQAEMKIRQKEMKEVQKEFKKAKLAEVREMREFYVQAEETSDINWEEVMITFMTDYADLIGQLQPNEKIVINQKSPMQEYVVVWQDNGSEEKSETQPSSISAEVRRKDVTDYKSGKINKSDFIKKITINKTKPQAKIPDLEMFASIFDRFYSQDLSETFYSQSTPRYELLNGYGVVFHLKVQSSKYAYSRVRFYSPGENTGQIGTDSKGVDEEALYPKFKEDVKNFMLDYGRTIRSLDSDEKVLLEINIQACRNCKVPKSLELSTKLSTLNKYDQQKLSKDKALDLIEIKEVF